MSEPRFQLIAGTPRQLPPRVVRVPASSSTPPGRTVDHQVSWRLLGANNRELGRSPRTHLDVAACEAAVEHLRSELHRVERRMTTSDTRGSWAWQLLLGDIEIAASSRVFSRMRECRYNLEQFLDKAPAAGVVFPTATSASLLRGVSSARGQARAALPEGLL